MPNVSMIDGHIDEPKDLVEVVRCCDCKHYKPQTMSARWENTVNYCCRSAAIKMQPTDFCSRAERKEGEVTE